MNPAAILAIRENRALIAWPVGAQLDHIEVQFKAALPVEYGWDTHPVLANLVKQGYARSSQPMGKHPLFRRHSLTKSGEERRAKLRAMVGADANPPTSNTFPPHSERMQG